MPNSRKARQDSTSTPEVKPRGANRAAGKSTSPGYQITYLASQAAKDHASSSGTAGDSDEGDVEENDESQEEDIEVYNQISLIPEGTARRDALRLTKKKAKSLPRVTAYATASSYRMNDLMKFFSARRSAYHTDPKLIDDAIYTPYLYDPPLTHPETRQPQTTAPTGDLLGIPELREDGEEHPEDTKKKRKASKFDTTATEAEIFMFNYGTVVIWGMTEAQEKRFLSSIKRFEMEKLAPEDVEMEDLNYYYANYSRIYNDVITLRKGSSYMTKLSLSHALSQSVKISLFEDLISSKIEETKDIPEVISETGKIGMPHKEIMQKIGQLFLLRTNINSVGSVLDSPVLQDMLQLLKESVSSKHSERLEQIVIFLIGIEILLGIVTILVDLMAAG
ncbi:hypothetical protein NLJ89_g206 [Agrocybe chaxingu]|uniref:DUF155 domain-containing protein n=1 Tax=Agrocybe chaxingu TaxID=84603 RepID=A0A9W8N2N3_9AGAR|nr:hypothetical protein NLJ89_g206 [Agrocybe chaxingu]